MTDHVSCSCGQSVHPTRGSCPCPSCGRTVIEPAPRTGSTLFATGPIPESEPGAGKAMASLIVAACSPIFCFVTGVPAIVLGLVSLWEARALPRPAGGRRKAHCGIVVGLVGSTLWPFLVVRPILMAPVEEARRQRCMGQLQTIGLALHQYHDERSVFPLRVIRDSEGKPLLSWRVALLPELGRRDLYERFHLDEPWDSPHNRTLIEQMPAVFACPSGDVALGRTHYVGVHGPRTMFEDFPATVRGIFIGTITDGTKNTILVLESNASVPWSAPEDLSLPAALAPEGPSHRHLGRFVALFVDASVLSFRPVKPAILHALLTRNGDEVVFPDQLP